MEDIKDYFYRWLWRDAVTKIITINFGIWLILAIVWLITPGYYNHVVSLFVLPGSFIVLPARIWTVATYMFTQTDFMHLLVNMLWFMLFGRLMLNIQGARRTVILYVYGGVAAALVFLTMNTVSPTGYSYLLGASCSVLAIVGAVAVLYPNFSVNLLIFGPVKLVWLCVAAVILFALQWPDMPTTVAHAVGLGIGVIYGVAKNKGIDITGPALDLCDIISRKKVLKAEPVSPNRQHNYYNHSSRSGFSRNDEAEMDRLLQKVSRSGYQSLTADERQRLFELSQRAKR